MPKVSIIIPVYNCEKHLTECIESILSQTLHDFELILVDDGSKDKSSEICDMYSNQDKRIKVFHKENGGVSSARNYGLKFASGEYFAFVDSDDTIVNTMYEHMYCAAKKHNVPLVVCNITYFVSDSPQVSYSEIDDNSEMIDSHDVINNGLYSHSEEILRYSVVVNKLYRRDFFSDLKFDETLNISEDENLATDLYLRKYKIAYVNKPFYNYRQDVNTSLTHQSFSKKNVDFLAVFERRITVFEENGLKAAALKAAKAFCELYISTYYDAVKHGHKDWIKKYKPSFSCMFKKTVKYNSFKVNARFTIFYISPKLYRLIVDLKHN